MTGFNILFACLALIVLHPSVQAGRTKATSDVPLRPPHCGFSNVTHTRVVGGRPAKLEYIHPICLPIEKSLRNKNFVGYNPFIAGWGALNFSESYTNALMELQLPVVTNTVCEKAYEDFDITITNKEICAGGDPRGGKDACGADSGGPLMIPQQFTYYQIGVVSSGH
uniref:venom protease-like n=1 Tax=Bombus vancouverensis nearcticus TaxID=2705178 RepID=UPI001439735F|nr:venom protease-like [Bombus vancouverensis nearcticus]